VFYYLSRSSDPLAEQDPYSYLFKLTISLAALSLLLCYITFSTPAPSLLLSPYKAAPVLRAASSSTPYPYSSYTR